MFNEKYGFKLGEFNNTTKTERVKQHFMLATIGAAEAKTFLLFFGGNTSKILKTWYSKFWKEIEKNKFKVAHFKACIGHFKIAVEDRGASTGNSVSQLLEGSLSIQETFDVVLISF